MPLDEEKEAEESDQESNLQHSKALRFSVPIEKLSDEEVDEPIVNKRRSATIVTPKHVNKSGVSLFDKQDLPEKIPEEEEGLGADLFSVLSKERGGARAMTDAFAGRKQKPLVRDAVFSFMQQLDNTEEKMFQDQLDNILLVNRNDTARIKQDVELLNFGEQTSTKFTVFTEGDEEDDDRYRR